MTKKILTTRENLEQNLDKGQHFLRDLTIIKKEAIANISKKDKIIEIGAGEGILTAELIKKAEEVLAFEIDKRYASKLNFLEKSNKNLKIIYDNALDYSWRGYTKIVSNIPFFLSEQIIDKAIEEGILEMTLIVGERFKEKLANKQTKIGIISNLFYNIEFITEIDKKYFSPPPRVNSWLIKMNRKKEFSSIELLLISILKRKGKLKNAILYSFVEKGKTKREARKILESMDLNSQSLEKPMSKITGKLLTRLIKELEKLSDNFIMLQ